MNQLIRVTEIPNVRAPYGPYVPAVIHQRSGLVTLSGRISPPTPTQRPEADTIQRQTVRIMSEMHTILGHLGMGFEDVMRVGVFLKSPTDFTFDNFNEAYGGYLDLYAHTKGLDYNPYPARSTIVPQLLKDAGVELDMQAALPDNWVADRIGADPAVAPFEYEEVAAFVAQQKTAL